MWDCAARAALIWFQLLLTQGLRVRLASLFSRNSTLTLFASSRSPLGRRALEVIGTRMSYEMARAPLARGVFEQYAKGKKSAIADALKANGGSVDPPPACKKAESQQKLSAEIKRANPLVKYVLEHTTWSWAAATPFTFLEDVRRDFSLSRICRPPACRFQQC